MERSKDEGVNGIEDVANFFAGVAVDFDGFDFPGANGAEFIDNGGEQRVVFDFPPAGGGKSDVDEVIFLRRWSLKKLSRTAQGRTLVSAAGYSFFTMRSISLLTQMR